MLIRRRDVVRGSQLAQYEGAWQPLWLPVGFCMRLFAANEKCAAVRKRDAPARSGIDKLSLALTDTGRRGGRHLVCAQYLSYFKKFKVKNQLN